MNFGKLSLLTTHFTIITKGGLLVFLFMFVLYPKVCYCHHDRHSARETNSFESHLHHHSANIIQKDNQPPSTLPSSHSSSVNTQKHKGSRGRDLSRDIQIQNENQGALQPPLIRHAQHRFSTAGIDQARNHPVFSSSAESPVSNERVRVQDNVIAKSDESMPMDEDEDIVQERDNNIFQNQPQGNGASEFLATDFGNECPACVRNAQLEANLPEKTFREMKLELIQEQILRKLRLKEPPNRTDIPREPLPQLLTLGNILPRQKHPHAKSHDRDVEDFYGETEQIFVFPEDVMPQCLTRPSDPTNCFGFKLPKELQAKEISSAELWAYKLADANDGQNQSFWVSEVFEASIHNSSFWKSKYLDTKTDVFIREDWLRMNVTAAMRRWLKRGLYDHILQIGCKTCQNNDSLSPIETKGDQRPFIVITIASVIQKKRTRRNVNCSPDFSDCCRESFVVSFREIGWDDWIISPAEYDAYYCKGSCVSVNGISHSTSKRTSIMQKYIQLHGINNRTAEIVPCCTATKMSQISLIYRDPNNLNTTVKLENLPNMVIESCGCF